MKLSGVAGEAELHGGVQMKRASFFGRALVAALLLGLPGLGHAADPVVMSLTGDLLVRSTVGATVSLNGTPIGSTGATPLRRKGLPVGAYRVVVQNASNQRAYDIEIRENETTTIDVDFAPRPATPAPAAAYSAPTRSATSTAPKKDRAFPPLGPADKNNPFMVLTTAPAVWIITTPFAILSSTFCPDDYDFEIGAMELQRLEEDSLEFLLTGEPSRRLAEMAALVSADASAPAARTPAELAAAIVHQDAATRAYCLGVYMKGAGEG